MKNLEEVRQYFTPHEKAFILIGPRKHGWNFKDVRDHVRVSAGQEVDPASIRELLKKKNLSPLSKLRPPVPSDNPRALTAVEPDSTGVGRQNFNRDQKRDRSW